MRKGTLIRQSTGDEGTVGALVMNSGFALHTLELPWEDNAPNISCIPCGLYMVKVETSPRFGESYHVQDVPGRTHIIFHKGNWAARHSMSPPLQCNVQGCILVGHDRGHLDKQLAVMSSSKACTDLYGEMKGEPFELLIMSRVDDEPFLTA